MKWLLRIVITVALLIAAVLVIGLLIPREHSVTRSIHLDQPAEAVWAAITEYAAFPEWRSAVESVEPLPGGRNGWIEHTDMGPLPLEVVSEDPPCELVIRIADDDLPFEGTWTYELEETAEGTRLTVREDGEVKNPVFRFMSKFIFGHAASMEHYLKDVGNKFGEDVEVAGLLDAAR